MSVLYINSIFFSFLIKIYDILKNNFHLFVLGFRRKWPAPALCKSLESAIQWIQIHHRITFTVI